MLGQFLNEWSVPKGTPNANWGSLRNGLYEIPKNKKDQFYKLVKAAIPQFNSSSAPSLVFRPPKLKMQPLFLDVDLKTSVEIPNDLERLEQLANTVAQFLKSKQPALDVHCFIVHKPSGYWKTLASGKKQFATGGHIYYPKMRIEKQLALETQTCREQGQWHF